MNTFTEKYNSNKFNVSSRNLSKERNLHKEKPSFAKPEGIMFSQKYLNIKKKEIKRVMSQAQEAEKSDSQNYTSINRPDKPACSGEIYMEKESYFDEPGQEVSRFTSVKSNFEYNSKDVNIHIEEMPLLNNFSTKNQISKAKKEYVGVDNSFEVDIEGFYNEQSGNIYCKDLHDYCKKCQRLLQVMQEDCETCLHNLHNSLPGQPEDHSNLTDLAGLYSDICGDCWDKLTYIARNCRRCQDIGNNTEAKNERSRNITFAKKVITSKKKNSFDIGESLMNIEDGEEGKSQKKSKLFKKNKLNRKNISEEIKFINTQKSEFEKKISENVFGKGRNLNILMPDQDFNFVQSEKEDEYFHQLER